MAGRETPKARWSVPTGASVLAGLACPASNRRGAESFANDPVNLARRRRMIPLPSETNDVTTPSVHRIQLHRLDEDFSSRGRSSGDRAVPPSHAQTILLRRTSHKKRYFLGHAARRRSSPSTTPLVHALARTSGEASRLLRLECRVAGTRVARPSSAACAATHGLASLSPLFALTRDA